MEFTYNRTEIWTPALLSDPSLLSKFLNAHSLNSGWVFQQGVRREYEPEFSLELTLHVPVNHGMQLLHPVDLCPGTRSLLIRAGTKEWRATFLPPSGILWSTNNDANFNRDFTLFGQKLGGHLIIPNFLVDVMKLLEKLQACEGCFCFCFFFFFFLFFFL